MYTRSCQSNFRASGDEEVIEKAIALEARQMVREAAQPIPAGETVKGQLLRAAKALGYPPGHWRVHSAWHSRAGVWGAAAFEELRNRYETWKAKQEHKSESDNENAARFLAIANRLEAGDQDFYRQEIDSLRSLARRLGGDVGGEVK